MTLSNEQLTPEHKRPDGLFRQWADRVRAVVDAPGPSPRIQRWVMAAILLACAGVRFATIGNPPLDRTLWKEIDYLTMAQNYANGVAGFLYPTIGYPAPPQNPVTEMELPIVPYVTGGLENLLGTAPWVVRLVTLLAFLVVSVYVFLLVRRELGPRLALLSALAAAVLPLFHPFGHILFSDPLMIAAGLAALYHLGQWLEDKKPLSAVAGVLAFSLSIGVKVEALWFLIPLAVLVWRSGRRRPLAWLAPSLLVAAGMIIPIAWYAWAVFSLEPNGTHHYGLTSGHNRFQTLTELTSINWYERMGGRLYNELLGGPVGVLLALFGVAMVVVLRRRLVFWFAYGAGFLLYLVLEAEGHLDAPYRQLAVSPLLAVLVALGAIGIVVAAAMIVERTRRVRWDARPAVLTGIAGFLIVLIGLTNISVIRGSDQPADTNRWDYAQQIKQHSSSSDELAALGEYDIHVGGNDKSPVLFYYTGLRGWVVQSPQCSVAYVRELAAQGATLFAALPIYGETTEPSCGPDPGELARLRALYPILQDSGGLLLLDLKHPRA